MEALPHELQSGSPPLTSGARAGSAALRALRWIAGNKILTLALAVWGVVILSAAFPALFASSDPNAKNFIVVLAKPGTAHYFLGSDELGESVYTRLVYGCRTSVEVGFGAVAIGAVIGIAAGVIAGFFRRADGFIGYLVDVKMAFPGLILVLAVVVMLGHSSIGVLAVVLGLTGWTAYARLIRGVVLSLRNREFLEAARASGQRPFAQIFHHVLPNIAGPAGVLAIIDLSRVVLAEASLSFLGLGIQPPAVSWGLMLGASEDYIYRAWWLVTFPGLTIAIVVLAANLIANSLQQTSDPGRRTLRQE